MFVAALSVALALGAPPDKPAADPRQQAKDDLKALQGKWVRVEAQVGGTELPADPDGEVMAVYKGDTLSLVRAGKVYQAGSIVTLDPSQSPSAINTWNTEGKDKDRTFPGIYKIEGDTLTLCLARPGDRRPTKFTTTDGGGFMLFVYKRQQD